MSYTVHTQTANRTCLMQRKFVECFRLGTNEDNPKDVFEGDVTTTAREITELQLHGFTVNR